MKVSLMVIGALAAVFVLRHRSAALRHWVLTVGLSAAVGLPLFEAAVPAWSLPIAAPYGAFASADVSTAVSVAGSRTPEGGMPESSHQVLVPATSTGQDVARGIWIGGAAVGLAVLLTGLFRLRRLARRARPVTAGLWRDIAEDVSRQYGLTRSVLVLQSDHPSLLVTWGVRRPRVILPAAAVHWDAARARIVLTHELAHVARGDWLVHIAAEALRAVYWFNPLVWIACRRLRLESEQACDDEVLVRGTSGTVYATHLVEVARALGAHRRSRTPAPAMARPSSLERRVRAMLTVHPHRHAPHRSARIAVVLLFTLAASALAAAQVSFVSVSGRVFDPQGRGIPGVVAVFENTARATRYEMKTDLDGRFEFVGLLPGEHRVELRSPGFRPFEQVVVLDGRQTSQEFTLELGTLQETIYVSGPSRADDPRAVREVPMPAVSCTPSTAGGQVRPPKKIRDVTPQYPAALQTDGVTGIVRLEARIAADGYPSGLVVVESPHPELSQAAVTAVQQWRFTPTLLNCQTVEPSISITIGFGTREGLPPPPASPGQARR